MIGDFFQNLRERCLHLPAPLFSGASRVEHHPWNIENARCSFDADHPWSKPLRAPRAQLSERHAVVYATAQVDDWIPVGRPFYLLQQYRREIARVQTIAHLVAFAVETDVT